MNRNLYLYVTLHALYIAFSASSKAAWKMTIKHLRDSREIVFFSNANIDIDIDALFPIEDHCCHPYLVYTRNLSAVRQTLRSHILKERTKEVEAEPTGYVCLVNTEAAATAIINDLGEHAARAKIVIYTERQIENLEAILRHAWEMHSMLNVVVISSAEDVATFSTYNPFEMLGNDEWGLVHTFVANNENVSDVLMLAEKLMRDRLIDMHDYPLNVSFYVSGMNAEVVLDDNGTFIGFSGMDVWAQSCLAERMNYRPVLIHPYGNGTFLLDEDFKNIPKALHDVELKKTVLSANMLPSLNYGTQRTAFTKPMKQTRICYMAPKFHPPPSTIPLMLPLDNLSKLAMVVALLLCALFWFLIRKHYSILEPPSLLKTLRDTLFLAVSVPTKNPSNTPERLLFLVLSYFSLLLLNTYQGLIVTRVSLPGPSTDIHTMEDLDQSGLGIGVPGNFHVENKELYTDDIAYGRLYKKEIAFPNITAMMKRSIAGDLALILAESYIRKIVDTTYSKENGMDLLYMVDECPLSRYSGYIVHKTSPYIDRFNELIMGLHSNGVMGKLAQDTKFKTEVMRIRRTINNDHSALKQFTLYHYWKVFTMYGVGMCLSILVFIGEVLYNKKQRGIH